MSQVLAISTPQLLAQDAIQLLKQLIAVQSFSKEETGTAQLIEAFFEAKSIPFERTKNNIWAYNRYFDASKPTILLNSHHDTVKPNPSWTLNPFEALEQDGKLYGLGSNDAGGALCALLVTFCYFYDQPNLTYNLVVAATAEEEISGREGLEMVVPLLPSIDFAIVGEPTDMQLAVAEKGLLVLDCVAHGKSGHAAREEGENAIYKALQDIGWITSYQFPKVSPTLGPVKMSVTIIKAGTQHNVVPDTCSFTIDVRATDQYTLEEIIETIQANIQSEISARSVRLRPSSIAIAHPIVQAGIALGRTTYGSPTTSDQALIDCPSLKMGPGHSGRSHTADEFIYLHEIEEGIAQYIKMLEAVIL
ncbi:MAG: M20/M25/M40 family metallo-hydrolase [Cytophagia bacterium]|nr:MAG: M20/M25/M40 family metallo-hydrolase [Cytophagales bacterium]TAG37334.1 MAG: M20/M25/M40 family metallo-hydrolase [Cytophagia bacterium]TAG58817.1 MAG: M20/M25/M40 family metallo-hydrolase [Runella slithyformis]TAG74233.1 MAG: M20/M25/M40 family metallo-hydrolase [Runella slithyformis]TAG78316.1 MAG: M20/M25/M40 family metallo-hydrolase [Cytophagales bacterium]